VLEHMVDCVLYFEGQADHRFRGIRAIKNRFGAVNELGLFAMTETGLKAVSNPSALFLTHNAAHVPGSVIMATWEGTRPLLVEIQALVDASHLPQPRRVTVGVDQQRLAMMLAIAHRHAGISMSDQDVFVNVVGGMRIQETGSDAAVLLAIVSSLKNKALPEKTVCFAELGLSGELRPVTGGQARLKEAAKLGFKRALVAKANVSKASDYPGMKVIAVDHVHDLLQMAWDA
jgi:DNA repair protein RadA/Sms